VANDLSSAEGRLHRGFPCPRLKRPTERGRRSAGAELAQGPGRWRRSRAGRAEQQARYAKLRGRQAIALGLALALTLAAGQLLRGNERDRSQRLRLVFHPASSDSPGGGSSGAESG